MAPRRRKIQPEVTRSEGESEGAHSRQYALPRPLSQLAHMCRYGRVVAGLGERGAGVERSIAGSSRRTAVDCRLALAPAKPLQGTGLLLAAKALIDNVALVAPVVGVVEDVVAAAGHRLWWFAVWHVQWWTATRSQRGQIQIGPSRVILRRHDPHRCRVLDGEAS